MVELEVLTSLLLHTIKEGVIGKNELSKKYNKKLYFFIEVFYQYFMPMPIKIKPSTISIFLSKKCPNLFPR
jgi:hypothetical protein